jgi:hypothetical protein
LAVSQNYTATIDPKGCPIVDEKLYLNISKGVWMHWWQGKSANIVCGTAKWPGMLGD